MNGLPCTHETQRAEPQQCEPGLKWALSVKSYLFTFYTSIEQHADSPYKVNSGTSAVQTHPTRLNLTSIQGQVHSPGQGRPYHGTQWAQGPRWHFKRGGLWDCCERLQPMSVHTVLPVRQFDTEQIVLLVRATECVTLSCNVTECRERLAVKIER